MNLYTTYLIRDMFLFDFFQLFEYPDELELKRERNYLHAYWWFKLVEFNAIFQVYTEVACS